MSGQLTSAPTVQERVKADPLYGHLAVVAPRGATVIASDAQISIKAGSVTLEVGSREDRRNVELDTSIIFEIATVGNDAQVIWRGAPDPHNADRPVPDAKIGDHQGELWIQLDEGVSLIPSQALERLTLKG